LSNPHDDLPSDTKLSIQIVIDGHIFLQTMPVETELSANWKVRVDCKLWVSAFSILRVISLIILAAPARIVRSCNFWLYGMGNSKISGSSVGYKSGKTTL
jgi:hypothetical protein